MGRRSIADFPISKFPPRTTLNRASAREREIARHQRRSRITTRQRAIRGVEHQSALDLVGLVAVALETVLAEDGLDLLFKMVGRG